MFLESKECSFGWLGLQFEAENRSFSGAKARVANAEMQVQLPKMRFWDFGNTLRGGRKTAHLCVFEEEKL